MSKRLAYSGDVQAGMWLQQNEWRIIRNLGIRPLKAQNTLIKITPNFIIILKPLYGLHNSNTKHKNITILNHNK